MAIDKVITTLPDPPTSTDPNSFDAKADAFVAALPGLTTDINEWSAQANQAKSDINEAEGNINSSYQAIEDLTGQFINNQPFTAISFSNRTISKETKTFVLTQLNKAFTVGSVLRIASNTSPESNFMLGIVTSYTGYTLTIDIAQIAGYGTYSYWHISYSTSIENPENELAYEEILNWVNNEEKIITLETPTSLMGKAHVNIYEEQPQINMTNNKWVIGADDPNFSLRNYAKNVSLTPSAVTGEDITFSIGSGDIWSDLDIGKQIVNVSYGETGKATITSISSDTSCIATITEDFTSTDTITSENWALYGGMFVEGGFSLNSMTKTVNNQDSAYTQTSISNASRITTTKITDTLFAIVYEDLTNSKIIAQLVKYQDKIFTYGDPFIVFDYLTSYFNVTALADDCIVVIYTDSSGSNPVMLRLLNVDSESLILSFTHEAAIIVDAAISGMYTDIIAVSSTKLVAVYTSTTQLGYLRIISVSDDESKIVTVHAAYQYADFYALYNKIIKLSETSVVVGCFKNEANEFIICAVDVSATEITLQGNLLVVAEEISLGENYFDICKRTDSSSVICTYYNSSDIKVRKVAIFNFNALPAGAGEIIIDRTNDGNKVISLSYDKFMVIERYGTKGYKSVYTIGGTTTQDFDNIFEEYSILYYGRPLMLGTEVIVAYTKSSKPIVRMLSQQARVEPITSASSTKSNPSLITINNSKAVSFTDSNYGSFFQIIKFENNELSIAQSLRIGEMAQTYFTRLGKINDTKFLAVFNQYTDSYAMKGTIITVSEDTGIAETPTVISDAIDGSYRTHGSVIILNESNALLFYKKESSINYITDIEQTF